MAAASRGLVDATHLADAALLVLRLDLLAELGVGATLAEAALVVEPGEQPRHQLEPRRRRREGAVVNLHALCREQPVLGGEDRFVELLLQHLVHVVNAELQS